MSLSLKWVISISLLLGSSRLEIYGFSLIETDRVPLFKLFLSWSIFDGWWRVSLTLNDDTMASWQGVRLSFLLIASVDDFIFSLQISEDVSLWRVLQGSLGCLNHLVITHAFKFPDQMLLIGLAVVHHWTGGIAALLENVICLCLSYHFLQSVVLVGFIECCPVWSEILMLLKLLSMIQWTVTLASIRIDTDTWFLAVSSSLLHLEQVFIVYELQISRYRVIFIIELRLDELYG